ncbi:hypothetical protein T440DRAFT_469736 [Plenodomus tracheiphilus IPT5]|uniref:Uncharacterized protein n=1 Tax=Plenodomus tracheiphilus IPT5 TaxID=1408161 RepID=A0A6A7B3Q8_9PLEO|nr:hypothetical protein T440DRAFT_469736 [Plenodomus tracheiphilus IPT5]
MNYPTTAVAGPMPWVVGQGGFGTLDTLPREVRQMIFGYAFDSRRGNPVTVRTCCGPDTTERLRDACRKHGLVAKRDAGRFNILQVSKAIRVEASWVVYVKTALLLDMNERMAPYIPNFQLSRSLRLVGDYLLNNKRKSNFWQSASRFRSVNLRVPESTVKHGVPEAFTGHLLRTTIIFCKLWEQTDPLQPSGISRFVRVHLGSMFQEMLPFNMESQAAARYGELLDWLCRHSPTAEPDFDRAASVCMHNLQCMLETAGNYSGRYKWGVIVQTLLDRKDEGGLEALHKFQISCAKNGVEITN